MKKPYVMIYLLVRSLDSAVCYNKQACSTVAVKFFVRTFCLPALLLVMSQITQHLAYGFRFLVSNLVKGFVMMNDVFIHRYQLLNMHTW